MPVAQVFIHLGSLRGQFYPKRYLTTTYGDHSLCVRVIRILEWNIPPVNPFVA